MCERLSFKKGGKVTEKISVDKLLIWLKPVVTISFSPDPIWRL